MTDGEKSLFERLKPLWEAAEKLGGVDPDFDTKAFLDEMWGEDYAQSDASGERRGSLGSSDAELAEDVEKQFKLIAAAFATGNAVKIDKVINQILTIRRLKRLGFYEPGDPNDEGRVG